MSDLTKDTLLNAGFVDLGAWQSSEQDIHYLIDGERAVANSLLLNEANALYAFVHGDAVRYIGKTTQSVRKRFIGYSKPSRGSARMSDVMPK